MTQISKILLHTSFLSTFKSFNLEWCDSSGQLLSPKVEEIVRYGEIQAGFGTKWQKEKRFHFLLEQNKGKDRGERTIIHNLLGFILLSGHWSLPHEKGIVDLKPK